MKRPLAVMGFSYFTTLVFLNFIPEIALSFVLIAVSVLFVIFTAIPKTRKGKIAPLVLLMGIAAVLCYLLILNFDIKPVRKFDETDALVSGTICDNPYKKENFYIYTLKVNSINKNNVKPFKMILHSSSALECGVYDRFIGHVHISVPKSSPMFNSELYYKSHGIYAVAYLYDYKENTIEYKKNKPWSYYLLSLRKKIISAPKRILPPKISGVINGIFLGEKHDFPEDIKENFNQIGLSHLLATSGIHISILSQAFLWFFKKMKLSNKFSAFMSALCIFLFMALSCFTPSVIRAGIMLIIYLVGLATFRSPDSLNSLGIAVLVICLLNPNMACDLGLILSFLSTLGIILFYKKINFFISEKLKITSNNGPVHKVISAISISLATQLLTFPIAVWVFGKISLVFIFSNLLIIPIATFMLLLSMIFCFFAVIGAPDFVLYPLAFSCGLIVKIITVLADMLAHSPFAAIGTNYGVARLIVCFTLMLASIALCCDKSAKSLKFSLILSLNLALIGAFSYQIFHKNVLCVALIPCKDGISVTLSKNGHHASILSMDEHSYLKNTENYFSKFYYKTIDYLNIPTLDGTKITSFKKIIKTYHPKNTVSHIQNVHYLNCAKSPMNLTCFDKNLKTTIWGDTEIENIKTNNHLYVRIVTPGACFLIFPDGGKSNDLPINWLNCDFLILQGLPLGYEKINCKNIFLSTNKRDSEIDTKKLVPSGKNIFSIYHQGTIYINIISKENYQIRRSL